MIHYLLLNADGTVFQRGQCNDENEIRTLPGLTAEIVGADDPRKPAGPPPPGYREYRAMEYPGMGDQLDAMWKVIEAGNLAKNDPAATEMLQTIQAVKARYPKP